MAQTTTLEVGAYRMMAWQKIGVCLLVGCVFVLAAGPPARVHAAPSAAERPRAADADTGRRYLLERVDDVAVVQLYVDGFAQLPLREKILIYHLCQAAIAGRDIFIDQKYKHALEIRDLIEEVLTHEEAVQPETLAEIRRYAKLFWINNGPHNPLTGHKNVLKCSFEDLARAAEQAEANGARLPKRPAETTAELLGRMKPILFDPQVDSNVTSKSPGPGRDILQASANNLYEGVTLKDLEGFTERHPLNSKLVKRADGQLEEIVWRAGFDDVVPPGMYAPQINAVAGHLQAAIPYAMPKMARALGLLIHYYRTGNPVDFRAYNIAWVADDDSPVDTINGFIEVYLDARGQKGAWEAIVQFNDPKKMGMIRKIAEHAQWFEDHMPYDRRYRKPEVKGITARAIQAVMETGDAGPVTPIGVNLPNPGDLRELYGSKSVSLGNVIEAHLKSASPAVRQEFCLDAAEVERVTKWRALVLDLEVNMHEVIGHGSGRVSDQLSVDPAVAIKEYYSALEESRADLVALWFIGDPKLVELGLVAAADREEIERTAYEGYTRNALVQLRRVRTGNQLEEDHMRNRQMIVHWLMDHTSAVEVRDRDGKTYYVVVDVAQWRNGVGRLLEEVQRIKSEGDQAAAGRLFEKYGIRFDPKLRDEVVARYEKLDRPTYTGFVMPKLKPVRDADGRITDVELSYPMDLETQMLDWSGRRGRNAAPTGLELRTRRRVESSKEDGKYEVVFKTVEWDPKQTAIIICDMWDKHWCRGATARVAEMAPRMNEFVKAARRQGVLIVHAPSSCLRAYEDHPARKRAQEAPPADLPGFLGGGGTNLDAEQRGKWPIDQSDGGCDCQPQCPGGAPWRRQIDTLEIAEADAISDSGVEIGNLFVQRGIENVILMGVHTNMCVIGRPFGLRNMVRFGKHVLLVRDLTDTMYNSRKAPYVSHFRGTDLIIEYIEKYVCPTITSSSLLGGPPLRFKQDDRAGSEDAADS